MTITLADIEAGIWKFAAVESTPAKMTDLLEEIKAYSSIQAAVQGSPRPDPDIPDAGLEAETEPDAEPGFTEPAPEATFDGTFTRKCSRCQKYKIASPDQDVTQFSRDKTVKDGFRRTCKKCEADRRRELRGGTAAAA